jgi:hypothetical protein
MWLWLRKKLPKSYQLWAKLGAYVGGLHAVLLFAVLFVYKSDDQSFSFDLNRHIDLNAAVVFLPLQKKAGMPAHKKRARTYSPVYQQEPAEPLQPESKVKEAIKAEKATTLAAGLAPKKKALRAPKKAKKLIAQTAKKAPNAAPKKSESVATAPEACQPVKQQEQSVAQAVDAVQSSTGFDNVQYLGQLDLQALEMQDAIAGEVHKYWSPPPGISRTAVCEVDVLVSWEGLVNFTIKKSSNIPMYDVSVRTAMMQISLPKQLWGKNFSIAFKQ